MIPIRLALLLPCFNEKDILEHSLQRLKSLLHSLSSQGLIVCESRIICVDDGSRDSTWEVIERCSNESDTILGIKLARNVGHQNALLAGLSIVEEFDASITLDADLQDDINVIEEMLGKYNEGCDIVYGVRRNRDSDSFFKKQSARVFYDLMDKSDTNVIPNHADFRLMSRRAVNLLLEYRERNLFLRGIIPTIGLKSDIVYYDRQSRKGGHSKYPVMQMFSLAIEGITSFSVRPIRMIFTIGLIFLIITISVSIYVLISMFMGDAIPGWASLMLSLWFIGSLVLVALGIIGEYIGKIYLEVKDRPRFIIEKKTW